MAAVLEPDRLDEHIVKLREGNTLTENEVKALCEKVRYCSAQVLSTQKCPVPLWVGTALEGGRWVGDLTVLWINRV